MEKTVRARLLGRPGFECEGAPLPCSSRKALWVAAYVALNRSRHQRARLASLVWGSESPRHALGSLRVALTKLPAPLAHCLEVTREEIALAAGAPIETDVEAFMALCSATEPEALERAVALYSGDLLQGAEEDTAAEFADWLLPERTRLRQLAHDAHVRVARGRAARGDRDGARAIADAWFKHEPSSEEMHRLVMGWLPTDQALAQYEVYRRARAVTHGAPASDVMSALADKLRHGGGDRAAREAPARLTAATSFIGRAEELAQLRTLLSDPACRLLTLHGMGGVGKTRLGSALAEMEAAAFPDGVYVIGLDGLASPELFGQTLARACGLQPAGTAAPLELVASFLGDRSALLLLDNLEHLLGDDPTDTRSIPGQVATLLRSTGARLKVIATSREPLRLQEEWVYELGGLAHPRGVADAEGAQDFAAVQFFAQRARQAYVGFSLAAELPNVIKVCELLEGLPLGLELAASWVRNVPCAEIASGLVASAQELRNRHANRAARHDSLGAVVAYSWDRLPIEQREALSGLASLRDTFSREAAEFVAHAGLRALSALTEKSLLQRAPGGRWHLHEVVRQFAWEQPDAAQKARPSRQAAACRRRDTFYTELLRGMRPRLQGEGEAEALAAIEDEGANIREAWRSCARAGQLDLMEAAAPAWFEFLEARSFMAEGIAAAGEWLTASRAASQALATGRALVRLGTFQRFAAQTGNALASLEEAVKVLEPLGAALDLAQARTALAFTFFLLGRLDDAERETNAVLTVAGSLTDPAIEAAACRVKGLVLMQSGRREAGRDLQRRALEIATRVGKPSLLAAAHNNLALSENQLGNFRAAESGYESALASWRDLHMTANVGRAMHNLGVVATRMGDHSTALVRYRAALEVLLKAGDRNLIALNLMSTGDALVRLGRAAEAREPLTQSLRMAERDGHMLPALDSHIVLAQAALATGDLHEAARHLAAAIDGAREHNYANVLADAVVTSARVIGAAYPHEAARALGWAADVARLPETGVSVREEATALAAELPPPGLAPRSLEELAHEARTALAAFSAPRAARAPVR
jgi:predicted ATPase/DNA-binding SARP family transcriptional activator